MCEQWLALRINDFPEALLAPVTTTSLRSVKHVFLDNLVLGLRESHIVLSIIYRYIHCLY